MTASGSGSASHTPAANSYSIVQVGSSNGTGGVTGVTIGGIATGINNTNGNITGIYVPASTNITATGTGTISITGVQFINTP